ncbi:hypothetical protein [Ruminococcus sp. NK3A76]|uniref:hypothetical protein n=1 Tax=Ruminococcus sp. NK3A76 TaxID=877411 RepID=UPI00048BD43C|nr:hypothetical protein [Ruminococcus sp. NK3A76]
MKILSVKNNTDLCEKVKDYCKNNWAKVYESFAKTADKSVTAERFPQTWLMYERRKDEPQLSIAGFYQLDVQDGLTVHTSLTPFITTLFVDPYFRSTRHFGETALMHAREMLGDMGYDTAYLHTDLVGYYEKYGFSEIGLDITNYGSPTKVYCADTITDIYYEVYDKHNKKPDHIRLGIGNTAGPLYVRHAVIFSVRLAKFTAGILTYFKVNLGNMTENLQVDGVQRYPPVVVRCCLYIS